MPDVAAYHRQVELARTAALRISARATDELLRLLQEYADELAARVATGLATRSQQRALTVAREIIRELTVEMARITGRNVRLSANRVAEIHANALASLVESAGVSVSLELGGVGLQAAQAVLSRPLLSGAFRSIRRESVAAVDRIIRRALVRGASPDNVAMELRAHILGAEVFPERLLLDRRRIGYAAIRELGYEATPENLAAVRAGTGAIADRARLIARTEPMNAEHEARVQASADSNVIRALRWRVSNARPPGHPGAPCVICRILQDVDWFGLGEGMYDPRAVPSRPHPRCVLPGTRVQGSFIRGFRSQYSGDYVEIRTRKGNNLAVTPNHPVLTPRGFVPAGSLREGDYLLSDALDVNGVGVVPTGDERDAPPTIEEVFTTLREASGISALQRSAEDLHGDARYGDGDIEVVGVHRELQLGELSEPTDRRGDFALEFPNVELLLVSRDRRPAPRIVGVRTPALGAMRSGGVSLARPGVAFENAAPFDPLRIGAAAQFDIHLPEALTEYMAAQARFLAEREQRLARAIALRELVELGDMYSARVDAVLPQQGAGPRIGHAHGARDFIDRHAQAVPSQHLGGVDWPRAISRLGPDHMRTRFRELTMQHLSGDATLFRQLIDRFPGVVALDQVTEVRQGRYTGHVYDLQTDVGYLMAGGIIISNCLCRTQSILLPVEEWGQPRGPVPELVVAIADVVASYELSPSQETMLARALDAARAGVRIAA